MKTNKIYQVSEVWFNGYTIILYTGNETEANKTYLFAKENRGHYANIYIRIIN